MQYINVITFIVANCTPDNGMGCFPCCGVTPNTGTVQQSGSAALGAATMIVFIAIIVAILRKNKGN